MKVSAYIPCFNNARTLRHALASVRAQGPAVDEILIIDDGSTDGGADSLAGESGVRVVCHTQNMGRGAARSTAMREARHEIVLSCDATGTLEPGFLATALSWFGDAKVAAVFGRITQEDPRNAVERWRGRHLFRMQAAGSVLHGASLATHGSVARKSVAMQVGNYDARLRHTEDADLGRRLLAAGFDVVFDPSLTVTTTVSNTLAKVLERYWRWNAGATEQMSSRGYLRQISYALKVMVVADLQAGDPASALISFYSPHYQFWRSWLRRRRQEPIIETSRP